MGTYSIEELVRKWRGETIKPEQAIGQILQIIRNIEQRLSALEGNDATSTGTARVKPEPNTD